MTDEEINTIKAEAAKNGAFLTTEFIEWASNDDMQYLIEVIEKMLNDNNANS